MAYTICDNCEEYVDHDLSEVEELLQNNLDSLNRLLEQLEAAKRPFEDVSIYSVIMYQDQLEDIKGLLRKVIKAL